MSRSTLYAAGPDGDMHRVAAYSNAWWFSACIWKYLVDRYLWEELSDEGYWLGNKSLMKKLWQLADDPKVPWIERVCHAATFDRALIRGSEREALLHRGSPLARGARRAG